MCTGVEIAMAAVGTALSLVDTVSQIGSANSAAVAQAAASNEQLQYTYSENRRQQDRVNAISEEQKAERVREANKALGTLRASTELGLTSGAYNALVAATGYDEGVDLSAIEGNRVEQISAIQAASVAANIQAANQITVASNRARSERTGAWLSFVGSGLQIGADLYKTHKQDELARNINPVQKID